MIRLYHDGLNLSKIKSVGGDYGTFLGSDCVLVFLILAFFGETASHELPTSGFDTGRPNGDDFLNAKRSARK